MKIARHIRLLAFVLGLSFVAFAVLLVGTIIYNRVSKTHFSENTGIDFYIHTPLKGTSFEWEVKYQNMLAVVMAPQDVILTQQDNISVPYAPEGIKFEFLLVNLIPKKYDKTIVDVCRQLISGTKVFDKNYQATDPELAVISGTTCAFFQESLVINGSPDKGIAYLVPCARGYYLLSFRADTGTYNEPFYKRIAGTFQCKKQ